MQKDSSEVVEQREWWCLSSREGQISILKMWEELIDRDKVDEKVIGLKAQI